MKSYKTKFTTVLIIAFSSLFLNAQSPATVEKPATKYYFPSTGIVNMLLVGSDDNNIAVLCNTTASGFEPGYHYQIEIAVFDKTTLNLKKVVKPFTKDYFNKGKFIKEVRALQFENKYYLIFYDAGKNADREGIYIQEIDLEGNIIGSQKKIISESLSFHSDAEMEANPIDPFYLLKIGEQDIIRTHPLGARDPNYYVLSPGFEATKTDSNTIIQNRLNSVGDFKIFPKYKDQRNELIHRYYIFKTSSAKEILVEFTYYLWRYTSDMISPYFFTTVINNISVSTKDGWQIPIDRTMFSKKSPISAFPCLMEKDGMIYLFYNNHFKNFNPQQNKNFILFSNKYDLICLKIDPSTGSFEQSKVVTYNSYKNGYFPESIVKLPDNTYAVLGLIGNTNNFTFYKLRIN